MDPSSDTQRGSRRHFLEWTSLNRSELAQSLSDLIACTGATVTTSDRWMPQGWDSPTETKLNEVGTAFLSPEVLEEISCWWLKHQAGANVPNWDLASTCSFNDGKRGLILIEGKAHWRELESIGKPLKDNASVRSIENHQQIGAAIMQASEALAAIVPGFSLSRDAHYQLANRVSIAWKLASLGVPTVLVYLGFIGDTGLGQGFEPFLTADDWSKAMEAYIEGRLPIGIADQEIPCGKAPMWFLIRSSPVLTKSPPASK